MFSLALEQLSAHANLLKVEPNWDKDRLREVMKRLWPTIGKAQPLKKFLN
jgi:hypothetical protein